MVSFEDQSSWILFIRNEDHKNPFEELTRVSPFGHQDKLKSQWLKMWQVKRTVSFSVWRWNEQEPQSETIQDQWQCFLLQGLVGKGLQQTS
ncbi:hypothetical protein RRG08_009652 [Elysia crispata]|uniref:Uncharacterized protein n=1 Tax=Elysia crispata TaxID=231223 RepID=A0AAE0ZV16_9GAST|nr:hypothetical protein RRG08_009652 [Elysia crispata]